MSRVPMDQARYVIAVMLVVTLVPAISAWYVIHPFTRFWRRLGTVAAYSIVYSVIISGCLVLWEFRAAIVGADLGAQPLLRLAAIPAGAGGTRDDDDAASAVAYARDAAELALTAGLPVERLVAHAALDAISGQEAVADPTAPSAATMAPTAIDGAARLLTDLGLTAQRPFRVIDAEGVPSDVADANPEILRLPGRALAVDGVREVIWRHGQELADLRRRSLLKRLLFLFASAPGKVFSKEAIVQAVWNVEYHPLRHDAALFTNIMRIRRLLGEDGSEIIRVTEDGYRFVPPRDFLFVIPR